MQYVRGSRFDEALSGAEIPKELDGVGSPNHVQHRQISNDKPIVAEQAQYDLESDSLKILLAEDNMVNQKVALALLKKNGYTADVVINGLKAVEAFREHRYDIILMDINMPEMDGVEATQRIRSDFPSQEQPYVIAVTANAMNGDRERYLACGLDDYVSKPIRPALLIEAIEQAINYLSST